MLAGAHVYGADISQIRDDEDCADALTLNVVSEEQWSQAIDSVVSSQGRLDVLVNCAGVFTPQPIEHQTAESFQKMYEVNQLGVFLGIKAAAAAMKEKGGSIVNFSSAAGLIGTQGTIGYTATKWAVRGMSKTAALELAPFGIRVNSIHPGPIRTPMITSLPGGDDSLGDTIPLGRLGEPEEVAAMVVFLASDASTYSTGSEFICDGGLSAM